MSEVTVIAQSNVLGMTPGAQATIERTPVIDAHIKTGLLVEAPVDTEKHAERSGEKHANSGHSSPRGGQDDAGGNGQPPS